VEDCIPRNNILCSHNTTKQDKNLRDRSLWKGRIVSHPGSSGMTRKGRKRESDVHVRFLSEKQTAQLFPTGKEDKVGLNKWHVHGLWPLTPSTLVPLLNPQITELC
jgi:hypothetical protein